MLITQVVVLAVVIYYVAVYAGTLLSDFRADDLRGREGWLVLSGFLYLACYGLQAWHSQLVCRTVDPSTPSRTWFSFFAAQPYKYLPSSLFTFSFRAKYAHDMGMPVKASSKAQIIEYTNLIISALALGGIIFLFNHSRPLGITLLFVLAAAGAAALVLRKTVRIPKLAALSTHREAGLLALSATGWTVAGLAFWASLVAVQAEVAVSEAVALNSLAFAISILAVFAPGGLGVREALFAANGIATPAVVLWRLVTVAVDAVAGAAAIAAVSLSKKR